jgi:hypothetical protein
MRRHEESQQGDFERHIKLGERNAECIKGMRQWCSHAQIERTAAGLYAEMTGLPIATYSIGCPKVQGGSQSMNLPWIFSEFLVEHCAGCPHHTPNGDTSWGQNVIDTWRVETQRREQESKERAERISALRLELRQKSRVIGKDVEQEAKRLAEFLEALFAEEDSKRQEAAGRLQNSARIAADLFPELAIDLLLTLAMSEEFSALVLPILAELAGRRPDLSVRLEATAHAGITRGIHREKCAAVIDQLDVAATYPLGDAVVEGLLLSQNHCRPIGGWRDGEPDYTHSTAILTRSFDANAESVQSVIRRHLQNPEDMVRVQLCGAVRLIQEARPQLVLNLFDDVKRSLELYEKTELGTESPSGRLVHLLAAAFRHSPEIADKYLGESMASLRPAVQEDVVRVYRDQFFDRSVDRQMRHERRQRPDISDPERLAITRLLTWAKDEQLEIDIRAEAVEALETACEYATAGMLGQFESLLGYAAIVCDQKEPPPAPRRIILPGQPDDPQLERMNAFGRNQQWGFFKRGLQKCLEKLCELHPSDVFDVVSGCLNQPAGYQANAFKACCVSLLGELGKDYLLRPRALPLIMRALMDYESAWVRATAIDATVEMFSYSTAHPPANVVDTIIVHLQDQYVAVHKAALKAVSWRPSWFDDEQALEVLNCLSAHLRVYRDDAYQLDDICDAILGIGRRHEQFKRAALRLVGTVFPTGEELVDAKIAEELARFADPEEDIAPFVAKMVGTFLGRHDRDRHNYYGHSRRGRMFEWLHGLSPRGFQTAADSLLSSAMEVAQRDPWECCLFASLFSHFGAFYLEHNILAAAAEALPAEPRHAAFRSMLTQLAALAAGNASLQSGDRSEAEEQFERAGGTA